MTDDLGFMTPEDWALIGGWRAGTDPLTPRERRIVLVGRLQREMNKRLELEEEADRVLVDGQWGPHSDKLHRQLTREGRHSFDDFMAPEVVKALLVFRGEGRW
jgi:hypothetical protein